MKCLQLACFTLCIMVTIRLTSSFPQCCPAMCCSCGCGSMQQSSYDQAEPASNDGQQSAEDNQRSALPKKGGKHSAWDKAKIIFNGVEAAIDAANFVKENFIGTTEEKPAGH
ncbi:uncharacterized protein LOC134212670 [Armigeres subalbatus]|uniref:uncharacterized protein LOC134212670 n=1 Tax=Armigeres subalbatus TaxID=124917 RepID=UPI002ED10609